MPLLAGRHFQGKILNQTRLRLRPAPQKIEFTGGHHLPGKNLGRHPPALSLSGMLPIIS